MTKNTSPSTDKENIKKTFWGDVQLGVFIVILFAVLLLIFYLFLKHFYHTMKESDAFEILGTFFKHIGLMVGFSAAIVAVIWLILLFQVLTGKWRHIRVFISYHHGHAPIVTSLGQVLKSRWINPIFIPYAPADHDQVIESVQQSIKSADLIIVLPGMEKSFVDAEIFTASTLAKPIIFLKLDDKQKTPDTSYKGYPVFDLKKLESYQFHPLERFILYVTKSSRDVVRNFARATKDFSNKLSFIGTVYIISLITAIPVSLVIALFVREDMSEKIRIYIYWGITVLGIIMFTLNYIRVVIERLRAIKVTRQKSKTGNLTHEHLAKGLNGLSGDVQIMDCILLHSLPTRE